MLLGGVILSTSLLLLLNKLASPVISQLGKLHGVEDELEKLKRTLKRLGALLRDAEQRKTEGELPALWLRKLKNVALDAEDVVDEFEYEDLRRKVENNGEGSSGSRKRKVSVLFDSHSTNTVVFLKEMSGRIDDIWMRLEEISKGMKDFDTSRMLGVGQDQPEFKRKMGETSSLLFDPEMFGQAAVKQELMQLLLGTTVDGSSLSPPVVYPPNFSVFSLVGMGGLGKTTLAQWVYNNEGIREHFHLRIWVFVSPDFDLKRITKQILEHVVDPQSSIQNKASLNVLQESLVERLRGKRFLLILDDVWLEDHTQWNEFFAPFVQCERGSKILITTRNGNVAHTHSVQPVKIQLEGLSFDDSWSIFKKHAFPGGNSSEHPNLESIGKEIVQKLKGIPLAVTTIAGVLRFETEERRWRNILERELWELRQSEEGLFSALKLSYEYLPPHLKACFVYCCVYHKGYRFDVLEIVQLWMAQGYVQPQGNEPVEDVGRDYFNELFNRSLLQFVNDEYVVHDLLHDMGMLILQHDFYEIKDDDVKKIPEDARFSYLRSIMVELEEPSKFRSVRTFILVRSKFTLKVGIQVLHNFFDNIKCLRELELSYCGIESLPDSISKLKHLRYLNLKETPIKFLPESLCTLYKLQTLNLEGCDQLNTLPKGMCNLINLYYLRAKPEIVSKVVQIGKLTCLRNLEVFCVSEENENKIGDLKSMNELRGKLCICNLHIVGNKEEAIKATLKNKKHLERLEMEWADDRDANQIDIQMEESIIESLQPPPHLKELMVKCHAGFSFPSWMNGNSISSLESLHLHKCINLNPLPPVTQWFSLKALDITSCSQLKELPPLPPALESLILRDVRLNALPNALHHLPLQQLITCQIPELREFPLLPATLKELTVESVGLEALPQFYQCHGQSAQTSGRCGEDESSESRKSSLSILKIQGCPSLMTLHKGFLQYHLRHLRVLSIKDCEKLVYWPEGDGFRATLCSLEEELSIERCPELKALPEGSELAASLKKLAVKACPGVPNQSLFSQLHSVKADDVIVEKQYPSLACCSDEALRHMMAVDSLHVKYIQEGDDVGTTTEREESPRPASISLFYDRTKDWSWPRKSYYLFRRVRLAIKEGRKGVSPVVDRSEILWSCLGVHHPWASSLRILNLDGIPDRAFLGIGHGPLHLPSLEILRIWRCSDMRKLPTEMLLCHLTALKHLAIYGCPELTLSSVTEGIRSIPSLEQLHIYKCTGLLMLPLTPSDNGPGEDHVLPAPTPPPRPPPLPHLRYLHIDDARLLRKSTTAIIAKILVLTLTGSSSATTSSPPSVD